jgi:hypothetical protein
MPAGGFGLTRALSVRDYLPFVCLAPDIPAGRRTKSHLKIIATFCFFITSDFSQRKQPYGLILL